MSDAKIVLADLLDKQIVDSLLGVYQFRDSLNTNTITLQVKEIAKLQEKSGNQAQQIANLNQMVAGYEIIITKLDDTIKKQKKEIVKQKVLKICGFAAAVVLPIIVLIFSTH